MSWRLLNLEAYLTYLRKLRTMLSWFSSLHFNDHFPGEPGLAVVYWSKGWWRWWVVTTGAISRAKLQSNHCHQQTDTQFLQAGCPSWRPTNSVKALNGKISHSMDLLTPSSPGVFQLCLWPLIAPGYLGGGLPCLLSALWCQYPNRWAGFKMYKSGDMMHWIMIVWSGGFNKRWKLERRTVVREVITVNDVYLCVTCYRRTWVGPDDGR